MRKPRVPVGERRRSEIIEAAVAIIAEKGLQHLSLSAIEQRADMSRGQLTYYFHAKEDILLAVFDRLLEMMRQRVRSGHGPCDANALPRGWDRFQTFLRLLLLSPPAAPEFNSLHHTFLAQVGHRDDFRLRLANLYEEWRGHIAEDMDAALTQSRGRNKASARTLATLVQALLHGLAMQRAADANAYDRQEMLDLVLDLLGDYLRPAATNNGKTPRRTSSVNGSTKSKRTAHSPRKPRVIHE
jgi:AcrR family transcriptional regulator